MIARRVRYLFAIGWRCPLLREEEFRVVLAPSVYNPELDQLGTVKRLYHPGLVEVYEHRDDPSVTSKRLSRHFCFEIGERNTASPEEMVALLSNNSLRLPALHCILGNTFQEKSEAAVIVIGRSFFDPKDQTGRMLGCDAKGQQRGDGVMSPRRFAILATALCGTVVLVGSAIAAVGSFGLAGIKNTRAAPIKDRATETAKTGGSNAIVVSAAPAATAITEAALPDSSRMLGPETSPVQIAAASTLDQLHSDAKGAVSSAEPLDASLADPSQALAPETPPDAKGAVSSTETLDECLVREVCIDQYLWSVYQRTLKQDTVKVVERRKVTVEMNGKPQTVIKEFTKLVDEDFTWKDPKAAEKSSMSLLEYVIGGMDQGFKLKLYHALHAMDDAGLSPGITSAFRDDYRQSLASGLKAATDRSYHGGSFRGGYGHGLAADLVSVKGETRAERLMSSENLWKWIDAYGKEFGIGRPYLDKDPAHVAPIDGKEYADHHRGANTQHARSEIKTRNLVAVREDRSIAKLAKTARFSNF